MSPCAPESRFEFRGKASAAQRRISSLRRRPHHQDCRDLPGQELFQYVGDDGKRRRVGSADVNAYLKAITGEDFTAKVFRTWSGTVLACTALRELEAAATQSAAKKNVLRAIEAVAGILGNTSTVCRKLHSPVVIALQAGSLLHAATLRAAGGPGSQAPAAPDEAVLLRFAAARGGSGKKKAADAKSGCT